MDAKPSNGDKMTSNPQVKIETTLGEIVIELDAKNAPISTKNFLTYVESGFYNGTIFHRVMPDFMIQGGGFGSDLQKKGSNEPIQNEADNGLSNNKGTVSMARTNDPHSASAQFFINVKDNNFLNHRSKDMQGWGYAVFGKVVSGMDVVEKIENVRISAQVLGQGGMPHENVPAEKVIMNKVTLVK
ncbi:MAG: peptidylprolyl isomerase [Thiotrichaceae bacterium]|nr:peptidylprolyl isomerase [Thiotrichaceae bacterium]